MAIYEGEVATFIKEFVEFGGLITVDNKGYLTTTSDNEKLAVGTDGDKKYVALFRSTPPEDDMVILNPFIESLNMSSELKGFYTSRTIILRILITEIMKEMIQGVIDAKEKGDSGDRLSKAVQLISPFIQMKGIDEKLIHELNSIVEADPEGFFNIYYKKKSTTSEFTCKVFDLDGSEDDKNLVITTRNDMKLDIRKRSWGIIEKMYLAILGTDTPRATFKASSTVEGCPRLSSYLNLYCKFMESINPYIVFMGNSEFAHSFENLPITTFNYYKDNLDKYYSVAKNYLNPTKVTSPKDKNIKRSTGISGILKGTAIGNIFDSPSTSKQTSKVPSAPKQSTFITPPKDPVSNVPFDQKQIITQPQGPIGVTQMGTGFITPAQPGNIFQKSNPIISGQPVEIFGNTRRITPVAQPMQQGLVYDGVCPFAYDPSLTAGITKPQQQVTPKICDVNPLLS